MLKSTSSVTAEKAEKYQDMLGKHFARKVSVETHTQQSVVHFPMGICRINSEGSALNFQCEAQTAEALAAVQSIIDRHIPLLKAIRDTQLVWQDQG
ncbi:DUF2218 domain-containing protein [Litoribrevibacter albus]|uniref:DUF2218 domain-containing protein n=1 Tax=Litoribrevibacter albus TaxID=1473156 RepID=A0AA37W4A7_9GAMM|nr:DUF2218 domain-containing protein [Litoribrevibacter albus]GLQ29575.1 hypothetical protein GCM10007876_00530 [Litoribrevibacter albus]